MLRLNQDEGGEQKYYMYFHRPADVRQMTFEVRNGLWAAAGGILLGGQKEHTFFGQFEKNDNLYFVLRYAF
jgi:hypothetical protein